MLGSRDSIAESDQGRSFQAFYDVLLSFRRQEEFTDLLERVRSLEIAGRDDRLSRVHYDWIDASEQTQATVRLLSEQLRQFLDDRSNTTTSCLTTSPATSPNRCPAANTAKSSTPSPSISGSSETAHERCTSTQPRARKRNPLREHPRSGRVR